MSSHGNGLLRQLQDLLDRREAVSARRRLSIAPEGSIDFSSNDFLSLSKSGLFRATYLDELRDAPQMPLGSGGSRLLDGNSGYAEELEKEVAAFHNAPCGLLFNSGFDANHGMFACLPQPDDVIVFDESIHASVHEGMRLSRAALTLPFAHNCAATFERILHGVVQNSAAIRSGRANVFIAVETVYSMDGDIAPVVEMLDIKDRLLPHGNGHMIVDEAHATGVYGFQGRGVICDLGVENRVLARLHTFGKALSSGGSVVLCPPVVREYLVNYARSLVYTTALGLPVLATIKAAYRMLQSGATEQVRIDSFQTRQGSIRAG